MTNASEEIHIRRVEITDIKTMVNYRIEYLSELQGERSDVYKQKLTKELTQFIENEIIAGRFFALIAEKNGNPIAFGAMVIKQIPGDFNSSSYLEGDILNMYTLPTERRKGISSKILEHILIAAKMIGISKVALHTSKDGEALYRKFGFTEPLYPVLEKNL